MNLDELHEFLYNLTDGEKWHLENPEKLSPFYNTLSPIIHNGEKCYMFNFKNTLKDKHFAVVKETRYTTIPMHFHKDMEMNYIYSGSCEFIINNKKVTLNKGELAILDSDVHHSAINIKNENDIVINFVYRKSYFTNRFLSRLSNKGIVTNFILDAISQNQKHDKYLIFDTSNNFKFHQIVQLLLCEYYSPSLNHNELSETYMILLFLELINSVQIQTNSYHCKNQNDKIIEILCFIEKNYKTCTLKELGNVFNFNPNYIGNFIKDKTGKTFQELKTLQQITEASILLAESSYSINEIISKVGCTNANYFYKKFKSIFHKTPKEYRSSIKN